ncbi:MAG TPA: Slp family lipoprotein, partial [Thermodesulfobacteriota bacterium]|nr:Slp family lipoprotein [Thermodesulfobacteriota bacterium]
CATHPLPASLRQAAADQPPFADLARNPAAYQGRTVVLSGLVLGVAPAAEGEGSVLELLEVPADAAGRPTDPDRSRGRALVRTARRLDPAIYRPGREVTVGGTVAGAETREVPGAGRITYPVIEARELHLFPPRGPRGAPLPISIGIGVGVGF